MIDLFQIEAGLLPQAGLEIEQTQKQDIMKSKKAKKAFFSLDNWDLRKQINSVIVSWFNYYKNNNLENIESFI